MDDWKSKRPYSTTEDDEHLNIMYRASCYCNAIEYSVSCEPLDSKICHCHTCQKLHGAPMQWASIFPKDQVLFTKGTEDLIFYNSELKLDVHQLPCKLICRQCHSPIADEGRNMFLAFPSLFHFPNNIIPDKFKPTCHIFYKSRSLDMNDDLPKFEEHEH